MVDRMRTTSALCVAEMCWVMCTMESMATSGLAWTRLRVTRQKKKYNRRSSHRYGHSLSGGLNGGRRWLGQLPEDYLRICLRM